MAIAFVKSAKGTSALASVPVGFGSATTVGNLIVLVFTSDDYNGSPPAGWNQSSEMEQQAFHGAYVWWRISTGETNFTAYTIGSATNSAWVMMEFSGVNASPYDASEGKIQNISVDVYTTDPVTPTAGERLLMAMLGGSFGESQAGTVIEGWTNSFTAVDYTGTGGTGSNDVVGAAYRVVTADGVTAYSTSGEYNISAGGDPQVQQSVSALIIAFKGAGGSSSTTVTPTTGSVVTQGRGPSTSFFSAIRIRDVLVNGSGQVVSSASNISLLVWYGGRPVGAPDLSFAGLTTDGSGSASWSIPTGPLSYQSPIFYIACGSDTSLSAWTCARMIPSYE